ncbi:ATP-grasp domain-containing protein [Candidatus Altiarchaeota archaeon]
MKQDSVLVTNAEICTSLPVARSLGRAGLKVAVACRNHWGSTLYSRHCSQKIFHYHAKKNKERCLRELATAIDKNKFKVFMPIDESILNPVIENRSLFGEDVIIPFSSEEVYEKANDKSQTLKECLKLNIPCPKTWFIDSAEETEEIKDELSYPLLIKPHVGAGSTGLTYVLKQEDLAPLYRHVRSKYGPAMLQEYIPGAKYSTSALYSEKGKPLRFTAQKNLSQYPLTGGPQVMAETIEANEMKDYTFKLLSAINWYGVANLEWIIDERDGRPKLMEINQRFWMSLPLSIAAGVDFPYLLYRMAVGDQIEEDLSYKLGVKSRWLIPNDFRRMYSILLKRGWGVKHFNQKEELRNFIKSSGKSVAYYYLSWNDSLPAFAESFFYVPGMLKRKLMKKA